MYNESELDNEFGIPLPKKATLETESRWLADVLIGVEMGTCISIVAEIDGKTVGHTMVTVLHGFEKHRGRLGISVAKEYRDIGIGHELMKTALEESRKAGLLLVELGVFANNTRAVHLYQKLGFKEVGRIPKKIYRKDHFFDELEMSLEL